jgi:hypothetical protein
MNKHILPNLVISLTIILLLSTHVSAALTNLTMLDDDFESDFSLWTDNGIKNTYGFYICSKKLAFFFKELEASDNHNNIRIPSIIRKNKKLWPRFLKGLFDTDGCLGFDKKHKIKHYYPRIHLASSSLKLINDVKKILVELSYTGCQSYAKNTKPGSKLHRFEFKGIEKIERWMKEIGFGNFGKYSRYLIWKKFGFCPTYISLAERIKILENKIDPNKYYVPVAQLGLERFPPK